MARARLLAPSFFTDERIVSVSAFARLLFQGLWTEADREGRLEDKPLVLKMRLFPADPVDVGQLLGELIGAGLITRYQAAGRAYLLVPKFKEHQHVHPKEAPSKLPAPPAPAPASCMDEKPGPKPHGEGVDPSDVQAFRPSDVQAFRPSASSDAAADQPPIAAFEIKPPDLETIDSWTKEDFWKAAEVTRRSMGYPPSKWPHPVALSRWWGEARGQAEMRDIASAFTKFARDKHWSAETPPAPFGAFMKFWNDFLPKRSA